MVINKRINRIVIQFQPEEAESPSSLVVDDTHSPGIADGIMRQFRAHEDIVVTLPNRNTLVIPFYSILGIVTQFEINEVTITDDVCHSYSGGGGGATGDLVSVTVSPSISADWELSSFFPINYDSLTPEEKVDGKEIYLIPEQALTEGDEYSYTITPGADWYVNKGGGNFGGKGEAVTLTATVELSDGKPILEIPVSIRNELTIPADKVLTVNIIYDNLI